MVNIAEPESWTERLFVAIASSGQVTDTEFRAITNKITIGRGERGMESEALLNGGRVVKFTPETDSTVGMTITPTNITSASGMSQMFNRTYAADSDPYSSTNTVYRDKYRIIALWTEDPAASSALTSPALTYPALRYTLKNGYMTKCTPGEYTPDGYLSYEVEFKFPAFNKAGIGNIKEESTWGTAQLAAPGAYTT